MSHVIDAVLGHTIPSVLTIPPDRPSIDDAYVPTLISRLSSPHGSSFKQIQELSGAVLEVMRRVQKIYFVLNMATDHWAAAVLSRKQRRLLIFDGPCIFNKARGERVLLALSAALADPDRACRLRCGAAVQRSASPIGW